MLAQLGQEQECTIKAVHQRCFYRFSTSSITSFHFAMDPASAVAGQPGQQQGDAVEEDDDTTVYKARPSDFECVICLDLLCDPVVGESSCYILSACQVVCV